MSNIYNLTGGAWYPDGDAPTVLYGREDPILTFTPDKIEILEGDVMPQTINIETNSTGTLSAINGNTNLVSTNLSGKTLTITSSGYGSGAGETKVDVSLTQAEQFRRKIQSLNIIVVPSSEIIRSWGDTTTVGDDFWWSTLKNNIRYSSSADRAQCLGRTKKVSLSSPILGASEVLMRCIGYDLDGARTLTFIAVCGLPEKINFGSGNWINSQVRSECQKFYDVCSAKNAILTVSKGSCLNYEGEDRNASVNYSDETVFLMSEMEVGLDTFSSISTANSTLNRAECTKGKNEKYQWFNSDERRKATLGNTNGASIGKNTDWWLRSCSRPPSVCSVSNLGKPVGINGAMTYSSVLPAFAVGLAQEVT